MEAPITCEQAEVLALASIAGPAAVYNVTHRSPVLEPFDEELLVRAVETAVGRHPVLSVGFTGDAPPRQQVCGYRVADRIDPPQATDDDLLDDASRVATERLGRHPFDRRVPGLFRVTPVTGTSRWVLCLALDHAVGDTVSADVLASEVIELYTAGATGRDPQLPEAPTSYLDYAEVQARRADGEGWLAGELDHWAAEAEGVGGVLRPDDPGTDVRRCLTLDCSSSAMPPALRRIALSCSSTPFAVGLTLWAILLQPRAERDAFFVVSPLSTRRGRDLLRTVGCFVISRPFVCDFSSRPTVAEVLVRISTRIRRAIEVSRVSMVDLVVARPDLAARFLDPACELQQFVFQDRSPTWGVGGRHASDAAQLTLDAAPLGAYAPGTSVLTRAGRLTLEHDTWSARIAYPGSSGCDRGVAATAMAIPALVERIEADPGIRVSTLQEEVL